MKNKSKQTKDKYIRIFTMVLVCSLVANAIFIISEARDRRDDYVQTTGIYFGEQESRSDLEVPEQQTEVGYLYDPPRIEVSLPTHDQPSYLFGNGMLPGLPEMMKGFQIGYEEAKGAESAGYVFLEVHNLDRKVETEFGSGATDATEGETYGVAGVINPFHEDDPRHYLVVHELTHAIAKPKFPDLAGNLTRRRSLPQKISVNGSYITFAPDSEHIVTVLTNDNITDHYIDSNITYMNDALSEAEKLGAESIVNVIGRSVMERGRILGANTIHPVRALCLGYITYDEYADKYREYLNNFFNDSDGQIALHIALDETHDNRIWRITNKQNAKNTLNELRGSLENHTLELNYVYALDNEGNLVSIPIVDIFDQLKEEMGQDGDNIVPGWAKDNTIQIVPVMFNFGDHLVDDNQKDATNALMDDTVDRYIDTMQEMGIPLNYN